MAAAKKQPSEEPEVKTVAAAVDVDRGRIRQALLELVSERGYRKTQLADVLTRAGIDRAAFERHYPSLEACFADLWEDFVSELAERTRDAYEAQRSWRDGMREMAWELYDFLAEDQARARICVIEINFAGELVHAIRDRYMATFVAIIDLGRHEAGGAPGVPTAHAEAIFGATWERVAAAVNAGGDGLVELVPEVLYLLALPYLGPAAAREELHRARREIPARRRA